MVLHPVSLKTLIVLSWLLAPFVAESTYADIPSQQFARVEVSEFIGGSGPTSASSTVTTPLNLAVGNTGLEATLMTDVAPAAAPVQGVFGTLFVQANSVDVPLSTAIALFEYEFLLTEEAELSILRFAAGINEGAEVSFLLERDGSPIYSSSGEPLLIVESILAPGLYGLTVQASASAVEAVKGFSSAQTDFSLFVTTVPEPGAVTLAGVLLLTLLMCNGCSFAAADRRNRVRAVIADGPPHTT